MKHQSYIRSLFVAFCAFFVCVSAIADTYLNPFAYRLDNMVDRNTGITDESKGLLMNDHYVIKYALSGPATSVIVRFWNDNNSTWSRDGGNTGTALATIDITNEIDTEGNQCNAKGYHTYTLDFTDIVGQDDSFRQVENIKLRWTIDVKGGNQNDDLVQRTCTVENTTTTSRTEVQTITTTTTYPKYKFIEANEVSDIKKFRRVGGVDICNDPYSYNFGAIFCTEAKRKDLGDDASYVSYRTVPGVYVFGGGLERLSCYGADWNSRSTDFSDSFYAMAPHRVRLSDDGKVFVSAISKGTIRIISQITRPADQDGNNFYEPNDEGEEYNHNIFNPSAGSYDINTCLWTTTPSGAFMLAPNVAMDVKGEWEKDFKMLLISAQNLEYVKKTYPGSVRDDSYISEYNFGINTTWSNTAPTVFLSGNTLTDANKVKATDGTKLGEVMLLGYQNTNIEYDPQGGFWFVQNRTHDPLAATMLHYTKGGEIDREEHAANRTSGGVRHNHNFTKLAVPGGYPKDSAFFQYTMGAKEYNYNAKTVETGYITIYNVSYHTDGSYTFTDSAYIQNKYGDDVCDFAWDFADNLYVANKKALVALALPHKNKTVSTPCRDPYEYKLAPVHEFSASVNPNELVDGENPCATIIHKRIKGAPYPRYLQNANVTLDATILDGCKLYKWEEKKFDLSTHTNSNAEGNTTNQLVIESMVEKEDITAHIGICVYEEVAPLAVQVETTFPAAFVKRELDDISYSTICFPFHLESLVGTPYQGASVLELKSSTVNSDGDSRVFLNFEEVVFGTGQGMRAGKPYLIQLPKGKQLQPEEIFTDVTCPVLTGTTGINQHGGYDVDCGNDITITFHGMLNPTTFSKEQIKDKLFLTADNRLVSLYGQNGFTINGLRGYFTVSGDMAKTAEFVLNLPEKVTTSIPMVNIADSLKVTKYLWNGQIYIQRGNEVYDLSGARVK